MLALLYIYHLNLYQPSSVYFDTHLIASTPESPFLHGLNPISALWYKADTYILQLTPSGFITSLEPAVQHSGQDSVLVCTPGILESVIDKTRRIHANQNGMYAESIFTP